MKAKKVEIHINGQKVQTFEHLKGNEITDIKVFADDQLLFNTYTQKD